MTRAAAPDARGGGAPPFKRSLRRLGTLLITVSVITPAASVFIMGQDVIRQAGAGALICFVLAGLVSLTTAFVYAELASAFPVTGGEYSIIGRVMGPTWGMMALGLNVFGGGLGQAYMALGLAGYLQVLIPGLPALPTALAATLGTILVSVLNIRTNAIVTGVFLLIELLALTVLTSLGLIGRHRGLGEILLHPTVIDAAGSLAPTPMVAIGAATAVAIFAYNGYGGAVFFGEEMYEARTKLAWVVFWSLAIAVVAETAPVLSVLLGAGDLKTIFGAESPLAAFIAAAGGPWLAKAISLGVALAIVNALIAIALLNARQVYASARDGVWPGPFNRALVALHPRFNSPWIATLAMGAFTLAACFVDMGTLGMMTGAGLVVIYAGVSLAAIAGRINGATAHGHYRMPWFPLAPALSLVALAGVVVADLADPRAGRTSLVANAAVMGISAGYYWLFLRGRGGWTLRGAEGAPLAK